MVEISANYLAACPLFNTKAMEAAGLSDDYVDPSEGFYSQTEDGDLAGTAHEGAVTPLHAFFPANRKRGRWASSML